MIVLPGGGYAEHAVHEAEPIADWLGQIGVPASVFRYPLHTRHPVPLEALRAEISRRRANGAQRIGLIGFSAGGHLAGLAALAPGATPDQAVQFAVLGYAITSMETETYRPAISADIGDYRAGVRRRAAVYAVRATRQLGGEARDRALAEARDLTVFFPEARVRALIRAAAEGTRPAAAATAVSVLSQ